MNTLEMKAYVMLSLREDDIKPVSQATMRPIREHYELVSNKPRVAPVTYTGLVSGYWIENGIEYISLQPLKGNRKKPFKLKLADIYVIQNYGGNVARLSLIPAAELI